MSKTTPHNGLLGQADILPNPEREKYERALGRLAMKASLLHIVIEDIACKIWGISPAYQSIVTIDLPLKQLIIKLQKTVKICGLNKTLRETLRTLLQTAEGLADKRNEYLHALWVIRDGKPTFCYRRKQNHSGAPSAEEILELVKSFTITTVELMEFEDEHVSASITI